MSIVQKYLKDKSVNELGAKVNGFDRGNEATTDDIYRAIKSLSDLYDADNRYYKKVASTRLSQLESTLADNGKDIQSYMSGETEQAAFIKAVVEKIKSYVEDTSLAQEEGQGRASNSTNDNGSMLVTDSRRINQKINLNENESNNQVTASNNSSKSLAVKIDPIIIKQEQLATHQQRQKRNIFSKGNVSRETQPSPFLANGMTKLLSNIAFTDRAIYNKLSQLVSLFNNPKQQFDDISNSRRHGFEKLQGIGKLDDGNDKGTKGGFGLPSGNSLIDSIVGGVKGRPKGGAPKAPIPKGGVPAESPSAVSKIMKGARIIAKAAPVIDLAGGVYEGGNDEESSRLYGDNQHKFNSSMDHTASWLTFGFISPERASNAMKTFDKAIWNGLGFTVNENGEPKSFIGFSNAEPNSDLKYTDYNEENESWYTPVANTISGAFNWLTGNESEEAPKAMTNKTPTIKSFDPNKAKSLTATNDKTAPSLHRISSDSNPIMNDIFNHVIQKESAGGHNYDSNGNVLRSKKGALGAMQVMPATAQNPGYNIDPAKSDTIDEYNRVGQDYLKVMYKKYGGDVEKTLASYNMGPAALDNAIKLYGDEWRQHIPDETKKYINFDDKSNSSKLRLASTGNNKAMTPSDMSNKIDSTNDSNIKLKKVNSSNDSQGRKFANNISNSTNLGRDEKVNTKTSSPTIVNAPTSTVNNTTVNANTISARNNDFSIRRVLDGVTAREFI